VRRAAVIGVCVLAVVLAALAASQRSQLERERGDRSEIESVSGELATALLTYDYQNLGASRDRVLARATGKFRKEYDSAYDTQIKPLLTATKATSHGTVTDIYVSRVADGTASVIVVANAVADGAAGKRATLDSYIRLDLVKVGEHWRVDGVTNLTFGGAGATAQTTPQK